MSGGMPELGSKISLISKADIRYEGRLYTVDPQECTIALANVRSFGTEDRETQLPVAPQNQIYEYILFRGSDIKDIKVVNNVNSIPNDPAIVQMTVQPTMGQPSYQPAPEYGHPMMGQLGPIGGQFTTPYVFAGRSMGPMMSIPGNPRDPRMAMNKQPSELSLGLGEPISIPNTTLAANVEPVLKDRSVEDGVLDLISGGSRSTTPTSSLFTRKSPTMNQGIQVDQQPQQPKKIVDKNLRTVQPPRRDHDNHGAKPGSGGHQSQFNDGKRDMKHDNHSMGQTHMQGSMGGNVVRGGNRGGWVHRGNVRGRGRGRGGFRSNTQPGNTGVKPKNTLKFDNDYDFEQANTEFETLRSQLAKTKIDVGTDNEKKDDSGNETGAGEGEQEEDADHIIHYDRTKSFFDNISCEAVERSKGRFQRTDWRMERKLNSETFGVSSTRRGGFRGHGYYNRGTGGMYRGGGHHPMNSGIGYRGGYRGTNRNISTSNNRKPGPSSQNNIVVGTQNRTNSEQGSQSQQDNNRLVAGTA